MLRACSVTRRYTAYTNPSLWGYYTDLKYYKTNCIAFTHWKLFYLHLQHKQVLINLVWSDWIWPTLCQHFGRCSLRRLRVGRAPLSNWNMLLIKFIKYFAVAIKHAKLRKRANRIWRAAYLQTLTYRCINKDIPINPQLQKKMLTSSCCVICVHARSRAYIPKD